MQGDAKIILSHYRPNKSRRERILTTLQCLLPSICFGLWLLSVCFAPCSWRMGSVNRLGWRVLRQGTVSGDTLAKLPLISGEMLLWPFLKETQTRSPEIWTSKNRVHKSFVCGVNLFPHSWAVKWCLNFMNGEGIHISGEYKINKNS